MSHISVQGNPFTEAETAALIAIAAGGGAFANTTLSNLGTTAINTSLLLGTSDGGALGSTTKMWSDLFLASGAVINFNNGDVTMTHSADTLTLAGGTLVLPASGLQVGSSNPFSDSAGTLTLQNVDALDATTESTIEAAIDTLANLTSIQGFTVTLTGNFIRVGAHTLTLTTSNTTNATFPAGTFTIAGINLATQSFVGQNIFNPTLTIASGASAVNNGVSIPASTTTISGSTNITTATGFNQIHIGIPVYSAASALTITNAATLYIAGAPTGSGAGPASISNPYALWVDADTVRLDGSVIFGTTITPQANDGAALGTTSLMWSDLFLASGGVINFNAGDITITHASNVLAFAGAASGYTFDAPVVIGHTATLSVASVTANYEQFGTDAATATKVLGMFNATAGTQAEFVFYRSKNASIGSATVVASGDGLGKISWYGAQQTGTFATQTMAAQIRAEVDGTVTSGASGDMPGRIVFATTADAGSAVTDRLILDSAGVLKPSSNDGVALGTTALMFSDLFLASGGVINWNNGNATLTHSAGLITSNVSISLGTSNVLTTGTIELGAASDTTLARVSAGVVSIEGVNILTVAGGTLTGSITLGENTSIALDPAGSADGKWSGVSVTGTSGYTQAFGDLVYLDPTDSRWEAVDANSAGGADGDGRGILGMVVSTGTDGNPCTILLHGIIRADAKFPSFTINNPIYASETAGSVTQTQPTTTDVVIRVVGFAITADEMYFNPSSDYITHT